jgi:predicted RecB family nuclease
VLQLCVYGELLAQVQRKAPERLHVLLGTGELVQLPFLDFQYNLKGARHRLKAFIDHLPKESAGQPCTACGQCRWRERCGTEWESADHLTLVANIRGSQIEKLNAAGITTVAQLAVLPDDKKIPGLAAELLQKLRTQAALQDEKRRSGKDDRGQPASARGLVQPDRADGPGEYAVPCAGVRSVRQVGNLRWTQTQKRRGPVEV